ncbi:transposase [Bradyrhizobium japonicum]|nr:transposase [Bradyrhizobium elkanii]MCP1737603.1 transposase [Bradyrhizobium elkanii]MCS3576160.1 transposase [Bradyrhizobium elkanii]MCS3594505.1 transposase [Bradyrhizobium elkanii]MCS3626094.1 transposase [Bradyrhizobium elkanii]
MDIAVLGIDLGKNFCSVVGLDASGAVVVRRSVRRETLVALVAKLPPCVVGMEACCGSHHLGRLFAAHGHDVRLMSPEYVRPHVKAQKNDDRDAEGIAEAATRPTMRFVGLKSQDQLDMQTLHRSRDRLVGERTAPRVTSNSSGCGQSNSSTREAGQGTVSLSLFPGQELQRLL